MGSSHTLDQLDICFDDTHAVANAGLLLAATLAERLGIEQAADQVIDLGERAGAYRPGRKLLTLVHALLAGGDCIDDADLLRCGQTASVLGHRVMAPSIGSWRPPRWGRSCARSPSGMSASSTGSPSKSLPGRGRLGRAPVMGR
ncbi:MAG TPA: hypothetical protein VG035_05005 [Actinomycetota bacterium]|nr:hypothetical protein [Actinomycetota bacterium]